MAQSQPEPSNTPIFQLIMRLKKKSMVEAIALAQYLNVKTVGDLSQYSVLYLKDRIGVTTSTISNIETVLRDIYSSQFNQLYTQPASQPDVSAQNQDAPRQRRAGGAPPLTPYQKITNVSLDSFVQ